MKFSASFALFSFAAAFPAYAQSAHDHGPDSEKPVVLDKVEVTEKSGSLTSPSLLAARAELALTPGGTEVVDAERYLRGRASTVADTFALSAGVIAQSRFGSDEARLSIRGSGIQRTFHGRGIRVLQDGVPLNLADGGFDFQALEPLSASYINVWRGGNALAYGSSTLGGAIDYISRTGRDADPLFARVEAGSFGYVRATLAGGGASGPLDGYAAFTHQSQDGFRDHADQDNRRVFTNAGYRLGQQAETRFYVTAVQTDSKLPGSLSKAQLESDPGQANPTTAAQNQKRDFELLRVANKTSVRAGDTLLEVSAAWTYKDLDHPISPVVDQLSNDLLGGVTATNTADLFGHDNRLRAGVLFTRGVTNAANFTNLLGRRGALTGKAEQTATNLEAFAENQFKLGGGFTLIAGAGAAKNTRKNDQRVGATPDYDFDYDHVSPKVGLRWDAADLQVYTNVSGSYEPPSFSETFTSSVARDAQKATTFELGTRGNRGPARWDASVYHSAVRDELLSLYDASTGINTTVNARRTTHSGVEFAGDLDLLGQGWNEKPDNRLVLRGAWTYGRFKFDDDAAYGDNTLAGLPPHLIRGELTWENAAGWYAGPTVEWVPVKSYVDEANTLSADPYALLGFRLGRRQPKGLSWFAEVRNVLDKKYAATTGVIADATLPGVSQVQFLPGETRAFYAGFEYRF